ncbi:hypothetical protein [Acidiphilium sp.]|uniref:hypothetical protein n=1 Tax=Acidiphilium sp. TaxID=527 RepID=UPI003CFE0A22
MFHICSRSLIDARRDEFSGSFSGGGGNTTGFASPAVDSLEGPIDPAEILNLRRANRYPARVSGEALIEQGILPGDILITMRRHHRRTARSRSSWSMVRFWWRN